MIGIIPMMGEEVCGAFAATAGAASCANAEPSDQSMFKPVITALSFSFNYEIRNQLLEFGLGKFHMLTNDGVVFAEFHFLGLFLRVFLFHVEKAGVGGADELHQNNILLSHDAPLIKHPCGFYVRRAIGRSKNERMCYTHWLESQGANRMNPQPNTQNVETVVFPVGGFGTRFLPATKAVPKEMLPVVDRPLIQYAVDEALEAGMKRFIFVTARGKDAIEAHFDFAGELTHFLRSKGKEAEIAHADGWLPPAGSMMFVRQGMAAGLGHAVWCARHAIGNVPFAAILPDDLVLSEKGCLKQMIESYQRLGQPANLAAVMDVPLEHTSRYGILDVDGPTDGELVSARGLVEKPAPENAPSTLSIIGRYILQPSVLVRLEGQASGAGGEIQLTDAMQSDLASTPFYGFRFEGIRYDCGDKLGFLEANVAYALKRPELAEGLRASLQELLK